MKYFINDSAISPFCFCSFLVTDFISDIRNLLLDIKEEQYIYAWGFKYRICLIFGASEEERSWKI